MTQSPPIMNLKPFNKVMPTLLFVNRYYPQKS